MRTRFWVALGGNVGQPRELFEWARTRLQECFLLEASSDLYATAAIGGPEQPDYLNAVLCFSGGGNPAEVLRTLQGVEAEAGRKREIRWGPRNLDLDLILFESEVIESDFLTLPHPRAWQRAFVLAPLADLNPELRHPVSGVAVSEALTAALAGGQRIRRLGAW